ncbi:MAG: hypothetical protein VX335_02845 [Pseudomonadota bacterium]|nr:hypothetical protein [Pseudomonadota bacterium]
MNITQSMNLFKTQTLITRLLLLFAVAIAFLLLTTGIVFGIASTVESLALLTSVASSFAIIGSAGLAETTFSFLVATVVEIMQQKDINNWKENLINIPAFSLVSGIGLMLITSIPFFIAVACGLPSFGFGSHFLSISAINVSLITMASLIVLAPCGSNLYSSFNNKNAIKSEIMEDKIELLKKHDKNNGSANFKQKKSEGTVTDEKAELLKDYDENDGQANFQRLLKTKL